MKIAIICCCSFKTLIKASDGDAFKAANFSEDRLARFRVLFVTLLRFPDPELAAATYPIEIVPAQAGT